MRERRELSTLIVSSETLFSSFRSGRTSSGPRTIMVLHPAHRQSLASLFHAYDTSLVPGLWTELSSVPDGWKCSAPMWGRV